jgi:hypothetical protein
MKTTSMLTMRRGIATALWIATLMMSAAQAGPGPSGTVTETFVEDSFFNPCTGETVDRSYTKHVINKRDGKSYSLEMKWTDGKGVGQKTGDQYRLEWEYKQIFRASPDPNSKKGIYLHEVTTIVDNLATGKHYKSEIRIRKNFAADGTIAHEDEKRTGIVCS